MNLLSFSPDLKKNLSTSQNLISDTYEYGLATRILLYTIRPHLLHSSFPPPNAFISSQFINYSFSAKASSTAAQSITQSTRPTMFDTPKSTIEEMTLMQCPLPPSKSSSKAWRPRSSSSPSTTRHSMPSLSLVPLFAALEPFESGSPMHVDGFIPLSQLPPPFPILSSRDDDHEAHPIRLQPRSSGRSKAGACQCSAIKLKPRAVYPPHTV